MGARVGTSEGTDPVSQEEVPSPLPTEAEPLARSREQLQAELDKALAGLEDLEELRRGFLGQTGVHVGTRVLESARRQFQREETRLRGRIALLERLLQRGEDAVRGS